MIRLMNYFINYQTVALALIMVGIAFIIVEKRNKGRVFTKTELSDITYKDAIIIGLFQLFAQSSQEHLVQVQL